VLVRCVRACMCVRACAVDCTREPKITSLCNSGVTSTSNTRHKHATTRHDAVCCYVAGHTTITKRTTRTAFTLRLVREASKEASCVVTSGHGVAATPAC